MSSNPVQTFYNQKAKLYQSFFIDFLQWGKVLRMFFEEHQYLHPGMKILDAGCGTGIVTKVLYELARRNRIEDITFHGFDLSPAMLELFRRWMEKGGVKDIQLQQANVLDLENQLPRRWVDYDLIISSALLEYIPKEELGQALGNLGRLLEKHGRLVILVTKRTWITRWTAAKWWRTNLFDREELEGQLHRVGFDSIQKKSLPSAWNSYILAVEAGHEKTISHY